MNSISISTLAFLAVAAVGGAVIAVITWRNRQAPDTVAEILHTAESTVPVTAPAVRIAK